MAALKLVGIAGSFNRPSKTLALVSHIAGIASDKHGFTSKVYDMLDVGPSLETPAGAEILTDRPRP
ncbi:NAD(P)H-dependent FMN reductase [Rhizobium sp. 1399]|nr:NAD(P)H-dependent FMN reductase [Rhizobium sp. 1399]